ncbi:MAG: acetyltransferase [Acidobacteriia bacterium]|nr:acetyltransferase [Terriglobia bacterium]
MQKLAFAAGAWAAFASLLSGQQLMPLSGGAHLFSSDAAVLEAQEKRTDLPCTVTPVKPSLGFDLKFHAGYDISIPLKELAGEENMLTMVFRVTPENQPDDPTYFSQRTAVPQIDADAHGDAYLSGSFDVGEGKYHVSWLMRDRAERVCSSNWDVEASLPAKDKPMALDISPGAVRPGDEEPFKQEPPVEREARETPLNVKVIVNFAPQDASSATLQPLDTNALVSILRNIAREPRIGKFSVVAFNMQEQRVIYRQQEASQIDFPGLGEALKTLNLGTVDLKLLSQKHGDTEFLTSLITREIKSDLEQPDAVIIAGPKVVLDDSVPQDALRQLGDLKCPVFYMNYNLNPQVNPWRDAIGSAVRSLKGAEFTISRPRDLFFAWTEIMGRIVKSKFGRTVTGNSASQ